MKVREEIDRGGFGKVELIELDDGSLVARKTFDPTIGGISDDELEKIRRRFVREVRIQQTLSSRYFVPVQDQDLSGDNPWFTMPVAEGNFREEVQRIKQSGETLEDALADILNALEELHELGFVHRDLKPENILLLNGQWCLTDFGLTLPPTGTTTKITSYASNWGTAGYCAPEQAVEFRNATAAVDIYAFGCVIHDIYGNGPRVPYQQQTASGKIGLIIEKCTETNPLRRFRSIGALRSALISLLSTAPDVAASSTAKEWLDALESTEEWSRQTFEEFAHYVRSSDQRDDVFAIFYSLTEDHIHLFREKSFDLYKTVVLKYCQWIEESSFDWNYCDVLIRRIEAIFEDDDLDIKAACALAAAELGRSHNRWFVMGRLIKMCGGDLSDVAAQRIQIEIRAAEAEGNFRRCAEEVNKEYGDYHSIIADALT